MIYSNGNIYEGQWHEGKRNGYGVLTKRNGDHFEGHWVNDRRHGQGYEYLVTSPESFAEAHRHLTLYLIFRDFHSGMSQGAGSRYLELAQEHYRLYQDEFSIINFVYDEGHKGQPDEPDKRTAGQPAIYLNRPGEYMYRRRFNR